MIYSVGNEFILKSMEQQELIIKIKDLLEDKKAENIYIADVKNKNTIAEHLIICSAQSKRMAFSLHNYVEKFFKENKIPAHVEGLQESEWILVFGNNIAVHIFTPQMRSFYDLESIWK